MRPRGFVRGCDDKNGKGDGRQWCGSRAVAAGVPGNGGSGGVALVRYRGEGRGCVTGGGSSHNSVEEQG